MKLFVLLAAIFAVAGIPRVEAESKLTQNPIVNSRINVYLGGFCPRVSDEIRLDADIAGGIGTEISPEEVLGLDDSATTAWGGLNWRISRRNHLEIEYFQLNRSATVDAITQPFQVGKHQVEAGARADTKMDIGIGRVTYGFSLYGSDKTNAVVRGGLHWAEIDLEIKLSGQVVDISTGKNIASGSTATEGGSVGLPLPHLGFSYSYAFLPSFMTRVQLMGFGLKFDNYSGLLLDGGIDFTYSPWQHFGFGAGFRYFDLRLEAQESKLDGKYDFHYWGPTLFLALIF